jgi:hypothetical protein
VPNLLVCHCRNETQGWQPSRLPFKEKGKNYANFSTRVLSLEVFRGFDSIPSYKMAQNGRKQLPKGSGVHLCSRTQGRPSRLTGAFVLAYKGLAP